MLTKSKDILIRDVSRLYSSTMTRLHELHEIWSSNPVADKKRLLFIVQIENAN